MQLNDRKINILKAIIKDYIDTAEPVGSRTIAKKYNLGVSSATIRNELSDLEEMDLLFSPMPLRDVFRRIRATGIMLTAYFKKTL